MKIVALVRRQVFIRYIMSPEEYSIQTRISKCTRKKIGSNQNKPCFSLAVEALSSFTTSWDTEKRSSSQGGVYPEPWS